MGAAIRKRFRLGLAPNGWDGLYKHLVERKVAPEVMVAGALARPRQGGNGFYDYFRNRVMFPITNEAGQVVGFGARAIAEGDEPKYLNSPETPLYRKGNLVYGLNDGPRHHPQAGRALVVEGYMDVIAAHAHGFAEAVAVLGTGLTANQARTLLQASRRRATWCWPSTRTGRGSRPPSAASRRSPRSRRAWTCRCACWRCRPARIPTPTCARRGHGGLPGL